MRNIAPLLEQLPATAVTGEWRRHVPVRWRLEGLEGVSRYGRWSTDNGFPVLYLGRPKESVIVEAYRHIVDPVIFHDPADRDTFIDTLLPRVVVSCTVDVTNMLDLRTALGRANASLTVADLTSDTTDREAYERCQHVAQVAHQLRRHGIVAPAATGLGETLILFTDVLPAAERPQRSGDETWARWPADPRVAGRRHLRVAKPPGTGS